MPVVPDPSTDPTSGWVPDLTCCPDWGTYDPAVQQRALALAIGTLWALTGRQFGLSSTVARPCNRTWMPPLYQTYPVNVLNPWGSEVSGWWGPFIYNGEWHNAGCGGYDCCSYRCGVALDGPVASITSVTIDGATLDPSAYVVQDGYILKRIDGGCWPSCTDTFIVTYLRGTPVPAIANIALGDLVCSYASACAGAACALPSRMTSLTRQGISVDFSNPDTFADMGLTSLPSVDRVVALLNPYGLQTGPVVMSPDSDGIRYQTWPTP